MSELAEMNKEQHDSYQWFLIDRAKQLMREKKWEECRIVLLQTEGVQDLLEEWRNPTRLEENE